MQSLSPDLGAAAEAIEHLRQEYGESRGLRLVEKRLEQGKLEARHINAMAEGLGIQQVTAPKVKWIERGDKWALILVLLIILNTAADLVRWVHVLD